MTAPSYHALTRSERDHLLATAHLQGHEPTGQEIQARVTELRGGSRPGNTTTYTTLDTLQDYGWLDVERGERRAKIYRLTVGGHQTLEDAAELFRSDYDANED